MIEIEQMAELRSLFPEVDGKPVNDFLQGIQKEILQKATTHLIGQELFGGQRVDNHTFVEQWFSAGNQEFAQGLADRLYYHKERTGKDLKIVNVISCLRILQAGLELDDEGALNTKTKEATERDLLLALLACNQEQDADHTKEMAKIEATFPDDVPAALLFHISFPVHDIQEFRFKEYTSCQMVKALLLFKFLERTPESQELLQEFYSYYGITHWKQYIEQLFAIIMAWAQRDKASSVDIVLPNDASYPDAYAFLNKFGVSGYAKAEDVDYRKLREQPLIELDPFTFRAIHPLFLVDKIYKSLYFLLNQLYTRTSRKLGDFRSWYTTQFSEGVCLLEILQLGFPHPDRLLFDEELNKKGIVGPPDAYLRTGKTVFLMESKDILINAKIKGDFDFDALIAEIKKKLYSKEGKPIGIGQIITNIRKLLSGENQFDDGFDVATTSIYPLLITHDNMYDTPGFNRLLEQLFQTELTKLTSDGLNAGQVKPLVLVSMDILIEIQHLLRGGKITFDELLSGYQAFSNPATAEYLAFSDFAVNYLNKKLGDWRSPELIRDLLKK